MITAMRKEFQILVKEKGTFFNLIMIPIILIIVFAAAGGNKGSDQAAGRITQLVPGFMVMFAFYIMMTSIRTFFRERDSGILARLSSTPMKPINYLMGMWASGVMESLIQCTVLLAFGRLVYNLDLGDLFALIPLVLSLSICVTGMGLALSFLVKSENQGIAVAQVTTISGAVLSGSIMSFGMLPSFAQGIGHIMPQYWAQGALQDIMAHGAHIDDIWLNIIVLSAIGTAGLIIALTRFRSFVTSETN